MRRMKQLPGRTITVVAIDDATLPLQHRAARSAIGPIGVPRGYAKGSPAQVARCITR